MQKDAAAIKMVRANAILYTIGRAALFLLVVLTVADIIYFYLSSDSGLVLGMMIPHMAALLATSATQAFSIIACNVAAYALISAVILCALLAGRWYAFCVVAAVLLSVDTLVSIWLFLAVCSPGYLPSLLVHIAAEALVIAAAAAGRRLCSLQCGVRSSLKLALFGHKA